MNELRRVDLNLLVVLGALLDEHHVSRAAEALGMSQPAVSHALARLREQLDDPLLMRVGRGLVPTALAERLRPQVHAVLAAARDLLIPADFDPATVSATIELSMSDYAAALFLPRVLARLRREAPGVAICVVQGGRETVAADLTAGRLDLALGVFPFTIEDVKRKTLIDEHFVCVGDREHWASQTLDLERYLAASHLQVSVAAVRAEVDHALAEIGQTRRIVATVPYFTQGPDLIVGTDMLLTIASRMVCDNDERLVRLPLPVPVPSFSFVQVWHLRTDQSPLHMWIRALFEEVTARPARADEAAQSAAIPSEIARK